MAQIMRSDNSLLLDLLSWSRPFPIKRKLLIGELGLYPFEEVKNLKERGWLKKSGYSESYICFECSESCVQRVSKLEDGTLFIHCDLDGQVAKFIQPSDLQTWEFSFDAFLKDFKDALAVDSVTEINPNEISIGYYKACQLYLLEGSPLILSANKKGIIRVTDCITVTDQGIKFNTAKISHLVTQVTGIEESSFDRDLRLYKRYTDLIKQRMRKGDSQKIIAEEEGLTVSRIRQILSRAEKCLEIQKILGLANR